MTAVFSSGNADIVSKSQFAALTNVTCARVSQWVTEGKISGAAPVGTGRGARIRVNGALDQLRRKIDVGQSLGNGISTRLEPPRLERVPPERLATAAIQTAPAELSKPDPTVEDWIKRERLENFRHQNRKEREDAAARAGLYMLTEDARQQRVSAQNGGIK
jgi:hypothetical protein